MIVTAGDQINRALRLLGVLAEGETPSAETSQDALTAFQQMLESWSVERLSVSSVEDQTFTWPSGQVQRTIGPSGNFAGDRPTEVLSSTYFVDSNGFSFTPAIVNAEQYSEITTKALATDYPQVLFADGTAPDMTLKVWPVPSRALTWHILSPREITQPALLSTSLYLPQGYARALVYNLACELAAEFGVEPSPTVQRIAFTSKQAIRRLNSPGDLMSMPSMMPTRSTGFNIYTGF